ncbi:type II toxin-antitoxin system VapC family toxin [Mycobacterium sp.]|uniref:type II toxin-antitoxin system VapC family toxin n=1 Tax=Mycobacterium sp. TaxID=1785 RepID=UPI002C8AE34A|nr:type II toxin-antitoxin system VapC family toxin [Mycobacterium sp.]HTQ21720.1 type II toxin-antitoxin system VapC family toxin [Mycobacterium sp.]
MILLDTNVLSALMQQASDPAVVHWLDEQPAKSIWTTAVTVFEIRTGIELLERGRRRKRLEQAFSQLLAEDLEGRVQPFDQPAALAAGPIAAAVQRAGQPVEIRDVQIAGIATARHAVLATRNTRHFEATSVSLVNPWAD